MTPRPAIILLAALLFCKAAAADTAYRFPDARDAPPADWSGPVFVLSQDYPASVPEEDERPWLAFDPRSQAHAYLESVLAYALEGNVETGWTGSGNAVRRWYHAPWLHWGRNGREFVHGLTHERVSLPGELSPLQTVPVQNWAVGLYNAPGGYTLGRVWRDPLHPDPAAAVFPEGTVSIKLLFTAATPAEVPYLAGALEWDAYAYAEVQVPTNPAAPRRVTTLRLLQVDLAVKDARVASTTGWVFGTFVYDGLAPGATPWERLRPVGAMWGNDPTLTVARARQGQVVAEAWINAAPDLPFQHLGWAGRLNGPVDNPASSCLSCHGTAQWPMAAPLVPPRTLVPDSAEWMAWFRNIAPGETFSPGTLSLDHALQLAVGLTNFHEWQRLAASQGGSRNAGAAATGRVAEEPAAEITRGADEEPVD